MKRSWKFMLLTSGLLLTMTGVCIVGNPSGYAQSDHGDSEMFIAELNNREETLKERYSDLLNRVETKREYAELLQKQQESEKKSDESEERVSNLSYLTYELFMIRSRIVMEELKIWQVEEMIELQAVLDTEQEEKAVESYLADLVRRKEKAIDEILDISDQLEEYIIEPNARDQYKRFLDDSMREILD